MLYGILQTDDEGGSTATAAWSLSYAFTLLGLVIERRRAVEMFVSALPIVAIVVLIVCSASWSDYPDVAFKRACELVGTTASAYVIVCRFRLKQFLEGLVIAASIAAALTLLEVLLIPSKGVMQEEYAGAWRGIFVHKNSLGQAMALGVVTTIALAFERSITVRRRTLLWSSIAVCSLVLLGSQSATSVVMFSLMLVTIFIFAIGRSRFGSRVVPVSIGVAAILILIFGLNGSALLDAIGRDATLSGRTDIWPVVIEAILKRPLFGYGYDTFWLPDGSGSAYLPILLEWKPYHAHNGLLELGLDLGLVGVCVFLIIGVMSLWRAIRLLATERNIFWVWPFIAILYFIFGNITEANIAKFNGMNWVIFVVASLYASGTCSRQENASVSHDVRWFGLGKTYRRQIANYVNPRFKPLRVARRIKRG